MNNCLSFIAAISQFPYLFPLFLSVFLSFFLRPQRRLFTSDVVDFNGTDVNPPQEAFTTVHVHSEREGQRFTPLSGIGQGVDVDGSYVNEDGHLYVKQMANMAMDAYKPFMNARPLVEGEGVEEVEEGEGEPTTATGLITNHAQRVTTTGVTVTAGVPVIEDNTQDNFHHSSDGIADNIVDSAASAASVASAARVASVASVPFEYNGVTIGCVNLCDMRIKDMSKKDVKKYRHVIIRKVKNKLKLSEQERGWARIWGIDTTSPPFEYEAKVMKEEEGGV